MGDNGSVTRPSGVFVLVDRPVGASSGCEYTADFTDVVVGVFRLVSGDGVVVSAASASVAAVYENAGSTFSPDISITVPDLDVDEDGIHDLSGKHIGVVFRRVVGSNNECNNHDGETWVVGDDGTVTRLSRAFSAGSSVVLVDRLVGVSSSCEYTADFPDSIPGTISNRGGALRLVSGDGVVVSAASASVAAVYENAGSTFSPDISISVPDLDVDDDGIHDLSGTRISVVFRRVVGSNNACDPIGFRGGESWVVGDDGTVRRERFPSFLFGHISEARFLQGAVVFVDSLGGASSGCEYTADFTDVVGGVFRLVSGDGVVVSAASASVVAVYENAGNVFSPDISITVPDLDVDEDGIHDLSGKHIGVVFSAVVGSNNSVQQPRHADLGGGR